MEGSLSRMGCVFRNSPEKIIHLTINGKTRDLKTRNMVIETCHILTSTYNAGQTIRVNNKEKHFSALLLVFIMSLKLIRAY